MRYCGEYELVDGLGVETWIFLEDGDVEFTERTGK